MTAANKRIPELYDIPLANTTSEKRFCIIERAQISAPIRETITRQYAEVQRAHDRIKQLRDAAANN